MRPIPKAALSLLASVSGHRDELCIFLFRLEGLNVHPETPELVHSRDLILNKSQISYQNKKKKQDHHHSVLSPRLSSHLTVCISKLKMRGNKYADTSFYLKLQYTKKA